MFIIRQTAKLNSPPNLPAIRYPTRVGSMLPTKEIVYTYILKMACKVHLLQDIFLSATDLVSYLIRRMFNGLKQVSGGMDEGNSDGYSASPSSPVWEHAFKVLHFVFSVATSPAQRSVHRCGLHGQYSIVKCSHHARTRTGV